MADRSYQGVKIVQGEKGWGGQLAVMPTAEKNKIVSVTGGGIHPVAQKIADLTGAEAVDGFTHGVPDAEYACVVIDCGGTARCGVFPHKQILTINVMSAGKSGPLARRWAAILFRLGFPWARRSRKRWTPGCRRCFLNAP